jgi:porphobilinogen synthase
MDKTKLSLGYSHSVSSELFRRLRRTRITEALRSLVRETELSVNDFIYPLFVVSSIKIRKEI